MKITSVTIKRIIPQKNLIGFASCEIEDSLFLGDIAIFKRLDSEDIRLVFPERRVGKKAVSIYRPFSQKFYFELEKAIQIQLNGT